MNNLWDTPEKWTAWFVGALVVLGLVLGFAYCG